VRLENASSRLQRAIWSRARIPRIASHNFVTGCLINRVTKRPIGAGRAWIWVSSGSPFEVFDEGGTHGAKRREELRVGKW
jgi:hypothetical protein